ncbi:trimethylamine methyltransferase family protein [Flavimaricola marinus]|uniref:Methyltransferase n=1 Tax=Flavimaricola marinus TaxID=1819565 RepID=A0A238LBC3_9RHOB|nr:trimethylamine methyltransferase family protein [Flavimaricola marinus]SMY06872.1 Trimethylamine methyltransferase (MTTB) [Flavimaricola marinus]
MADTDIMAPEAGKPTRRTRGTRRPARSAAHGHNPWLEVPYITRKVPTYDLLDEESLVRIEEAADTILAEIGIEFRDDPVTVEMFRKAGGTVTKLGDATWNIRFDRGLIRALCATAPPRFTQVARNRARSVEIGGDAMIFVPSYGSPFMLEPNGDRRYATLNDFQTLIKLAQSTPWLHHSGGTICEPTDIPVNKRHLDMVYSHVKYSDHAFLGSITAPERAADSIEMCRILFGSDVVDQNCVIMGNFNSTSPLVWDGVTTRGIRTYAEAGQGSIHLPFLLGGAVTPVTMAGSCAQSLAESMVGVALTQLTKPGAPAILAAFLSSLDLRSGSPTFGTPEPALGSLVMGQLARRINLPLRCSGNFSTSKLPDAQSMSQSVMSMMAAVQCGANFILHSAGYLDGLLSMSYEKFVLDSDLCGALHAYLKGLEVSDETLGLDALREGGPGAHMFGTQHTLRHYEHAYYDSALDDYRPWETWDEGGRGDAMSRATTRWQQTIASYEAPPLDDAIDEELLAFIAKRKESMEDAWH